MNTGPNAIRNEHCGSSSDAIDSCLSTRKTAAAVVSAEKENACRSYFGTPRKEPKSSKPLDYFSATGLLDDDFDESIFEEIDILCNQKSAEKAALEELDSSHDKKDFSESNVVVDDVNLSSGTTSASKDIRIGDILSNEVDLDGKEEQMDTWKSLKSGNMPEEYLKYLQSLNDRQREAACTDISTPLMIVAGPGSGKVFSFFFSS